MRTEHDRPHRMDDPHDGSRDGEAPVATETPSRFPVLEEPSWLDDEEFEDVEAPRDSAFPGIWIGVAAAAIPFPPLFPIPPCPRLAPPRPPPPPAPPSPPPPPPIPP